MYLTQWFRIQHGTHIESLNDNTEEKNIGIVGGSTANPDRSSG